MREQLQSPGRWVASAWRAFDRWPLWARVLTGLVLLTAVTAPVAGSGEDTPPERSRPEAHAAPSTTTTAPPPATTPALPPSTVAPLGAVNPGDPRQTAAELLDLTSLSRSVLIDQLEQDGYSEADAAASVDALDVDWNQQAAAKAAEYLRFRPFDRRGLTEQLLVEGFTLEQAEYGVSTTGL